MPNESCMVGSSTKGNVHLQDTVSFEDFVIGFSAKRILYGGQ